MNKHTFTPEDVQFIELLISVKTITEISKYLKKNKIEPNSENYLYGKLRKIKEELNVDNTLDVILSFIDLGLIKNYK